MPNQSVLTALGNHDTKHFLGKICSPPNGMNRCQVSPAFSCSTRCTSTMAILVGHRIIGGKPKLFGEMEARHMA